MTNGMDLENESRLTRVETKLDILLQRAEGLATKEHIQREMKLLEERIDDQDKKIRDLTSFRESINQKIAWVAGAFGVIFTAIAYAGKYLWSLVMHQHPSP